MMTHDAPSPVLRRMTLAATEPESAAAPAPVAREGSAPPAAPGAEAVPRLALPVARWHLRLRSL
ncbi:hypothetical protein, partial [Salmonella enterica]|uniref:hypothetical protein n=1 Tax=Salmonella enterica TaxID=28901 RepID=UPI0019D650FF